MSRVGGLYSFHIWGLCSVCGAVAPAGTGLRADGLAASHRLKVRPEVEEVGAFELDLSASLGEAGVHDSAQGAKSASGGLAQDAHSHKLSKNKSLPWYMKPRVRGVASHPHLAGLSATGDFNADILSAHNKARGRAALPLLQWNEYLTVMATEHVHRLAKEGCQIQNSPLNSRYQAGGFPYIGENLYKITGMEPTGVDIVDAWYHEVDDYTYGPVKNPCTRKLCAHRVSPPCSHGHFVAIMWNTTRQLGCAVARCPSVATPTFISVCNYGPGGNAVGRLPFDSAHAANVGLGSQACDEPSIWPISFKQQGGAATVDS